jgi:hypothetical protein
MASKQSLLVLAAVAACLLLLPDASLATDVDYCSEYPAPGTPAPSGLSRAADSRAGYGKLGS